MHNKLLAGVALALGMTATAAYADMVVVVAGPMTGDVAAFGEQMVAGAQQAVDDLNAAGGVLGEKLILQIEDDACTPAQAVAVANKIAGQDNIGLVAGHFCSSTSIAAAAIYADEEIIMISPGSTNPRLTSERAGPGIFRVCGRDDQQGEVAGTYLAAHYPTANIAIVHDKSTYGQGLADETKKFLNAAGKTEVLFDSVTAGQQDYSALVTLLKSANVDVLYFGGYYAEAGLIKRQMASQQMNTIVVGGDALLNADYFAITGPVGAGTLMSFNPDPAKDPANADILARFNANGRLVEGYTLYTYAAIQAWAQAVEDAGEFEFDDVVEALDDGQFDTVLGNFEFDANGDPDLPGFLFYEFKADGTWDYAAP